MSANSVAGVGTLPRVDLAAFEPADHGVNLVFWEAKTFSNPEAQVGRRSEARSKSTKR